MKTMSETMTDQANSDLRALAASVVVPVRNRGDLLGACLKKLTASAGEPLGYEVVVCDDGSTEDLIEVVGKFRDQACTVRLVRQPPTGPAAARNLGVRSSAAPTVVFVDSDVLPETDMVSRLVAALEEHVDWVGAEARLEPMDGEDNPLWDAPVSRQGGHYHTAAIAYRRSVLDAVGGMDESFPYAACEDVELAYRAQQRGPIGFVPEAVAWHPRRRHTFASLWRSRRHWRVVALMAVRYGFVAWPRNPTRWPRLRTALCAVLTLPLGRMRNGIKWLFKSPSVGMIALAQGAFSAVCGLAALPAILTAPRTERKGWLGKSKLGDWSSEIGDGAR